MVEGDFEEVGSGGGVWTVAGGIFSTLGLSADGVVDMEIESFI